MEKFFWLSRWSESEAEVTLTQVNRTSLTWLHVQRCLELRGTVDGVGGGPGRGEGCARLGQVTERVVRLTLQQLNLHQQSFVVHLFQLLEQLGACGEEKQMRVKVMHINCCNNFVLHLVNSSRGKCTIIVLVCAARSPLSLSLGGNISTSLPNSTQISIYTPEE